MRFGRTGSARVRTYWTSWFTLPKLAPGRYLFGCFLTNAHGMLHLAIGMAADVAANPPLSGLVTRHPSLTLESVRE